MPDQANQQDILVTPQAVAERLCVSLENVYAMIRNGDLEGTRIGRRNLRVFAASVDAHIEQGRAHVGR